MTSTSTAPHEKHSHGRRRSHRRHSSRPPTAAVAPAAGRTTITLGFADRFGGAARSRTASAASTASTASADRLRSTALLGRGGRRRRWRHHARRGEGRGSEGRGEPVFLPGERVPAGQDLCPGRFMPLSAKRAHTKTTQLVYCGEREGRLTAQVDPDRAADRCARPSPRS